MIPPDDDGPEPYDPTPEQEARDLATSERAWVIASLAASSHPSDAEIADEVGCSRSRVAQIRGEQGIAASRPAHRPRGTAVTHRSEAGRIALAALVTVAERHGVSVEDVIVAGDAALTARAGTPAAPT